MWKPVKATAEAANECKHWPQLQEPRRQNTSPSFVSGAQEEKGKEGGGIVSPNPARNNSRNSACLTCMRSWVCKSLTSRRRKRESGEYSPIRQKTQTYRFRKAARSLSNRETHETPSCHTIARLLKRRDKGGDRKQQEKHITAPTG